MFFVINYTFDAYFIVEVSVVSSGEIRKGADKTAIGCTVLLCNFSRWYYVHVHVPPQEQGAPETPDTSVAVREDDSRMDDRTVSIETLRSFGTGPIQTETCCYILVTEKSAL